MIMVKSRASECEIVMSELIAMTDWLTHSRIRNVRHD
jgi:hypothetical protein